MVHNPLGLPATETAGQSRAEVSQRWRLHDQSGLTLVEVLVSLGILAVLLTATATSLVAFARESAVSEHRLQATAFMTSLHENLQAVPWNRVGLYAGEFDGRLDSDVDGLEGLTGELANRLILDGDTPTFDGEPLVIIPGPFNSDCPATSPDCARLGFVPRTFSEVSRDGRDFEVFQIVTERAADGGSEAQLKRFVTIVQWKILGREFQEVFESERAPTAAETRDPEDPEVRLALVSPRLIEVSPEGDGLSAQNNNTVTVAARLRDSANSVSLSFRGADGSVETHMLNDDNQVNQPPQTAWVLELPPAVLTNLPLPTEDDQDPIPEAFDMRVVARDAAGIVLADQVLNVFLLRTTSPVPSPELTGTGVPPATATVRVGVEAGFEDVLCDNVSGSVEVSWTEFTNSDSSGAPPRAYFAGKTTQSAAMDADLWLDAGNRWRFVVEFEAGDPSPWLPPRADPSESSTSVERLYFISEVDEGEGASQILQSEPFTVERLSEGFPCDPNE